MQTQESDKAGLHVMGAVPQNGNWGRDSNAANNAATATTVPSMKFGTNKLARDNQLDYLLVLRAIACLLVVLSHTTGEFPHSNLLTIFGHDYTWTVTVVGTTGVWIFFVLSGYLMGKGFFTGRYQSGFSGTIKFYRDRFLRIYPLYITSIIVTCAVFHKIYPLNWQNIKAIIQLLFFSYYEQTAFPDSVLWTISTEFRFYLLAPFLFLFVRRFVKTSTAALILALGVTIAQITYRIWVYSHYHHTAGWPLEWLFRIYIPLSGNLDAFILGFLSNTFVLKWNSGNRSWQPTKALGWIVLVIGYICSAYVGYRGYLLGQHFFGPLFYCGLQSITVVGISVVLFCFEAGDVQRRAPLSLQALKKNPLRVIETFGIVTFGIYVWHLLILTLARDVHFPVSTPQGTFYSRLIFVIGLTTALAAVTYLLIEKPFLRLRSARVPLPSASVVFKYRLQRFDLQKRSK